MKYVTNFSRGCFHHWTASKAIMELVQNALDSDGEFTWDIGEDYVELTNHNIKVSNKLLMMGMSDKRNDDSKRGQFGVGSVQAMVVLTDLGCKVEIHNNDVVWTPTFEYCDKFNEDIMVVEERSSESPNSNFTVRIAGLSSGDIEEVKQRCLVFQDREVLHSTEYGDIVENLEGETGEVFCGDLYVCQNNRFAYSYNFKPKVIKLSQDRDAVSQWDMQSITAKLIMATEDDEFIKKAMKTGMLDTELVKYSIAYTPDSVNDSLAEEFLEEHGVVLVTSDYSEHEHNIKVGNKSVYKPNHVIVKSIQTSTIYKEAITQLEIVEKESFTSLIERFFDDVEYLLDSSNVKTKDTRKLLEEIRERVNNSDFE